MIEYILVVLVLFFGAAASYLAYERFRGRRSHSDTSAYVGALIDLLDGKQESAFSKLRQVVAEDSGNLDAYLRLGQILRENKSPERALQVHKDLTLRGSLLPEQKRAVLRQLAADYVALDEPATAEKALKEIIAGHSQDRWAHSALLKLQESAHKWEDACNTAEQILRLEANKSRKPLARYKFELGEQLARKREYHKARIIFKEAIGLDPNFVLAYLAIGDSYAEEKRSEDAVNFWGKLIQAVPQEGHMVIDRLKRTLFDLGRFGDIARTCENILEHDPKNIEARRTLAEFHEKKGDLGTAAEVLEQIIDDYPDNYLTVLELVRVYLELGERRKIDELLRHLEHKRETLKSAESGRAASTSTASR